jgi:Tfp pilus assembly protein PilF
LIRLEPDNYIAYYTKGKVYASRNEDDSAVSAYRKCIFLKSDHDEAWNNLGNLLMRKYQRFDEAMDDFNKAISLNPSGLYYGNRSVCYYNMGEKEKARQDALTAIEKGINVPANYRKALNIE